MIYGRDEATQPAAVAETKTLEMITRMVEEKLGKRSSDTNSANSVKNIIPGFYTVKDALQLDMNTVKELHHENLGELEAVNLNYKNFVKAEGAVLTDGEGNKHIDFLASIGVAQLGYCNDFVWKNIEECYKSRSYMIGAFAYHNVAAAYAHNMAKLSPGGKLTKLHTFTSGSEAIENAIKMVKLASRNRSEKTHILACVGAYHGMTTGAVSLMGNPHLQKYQAPLMENVDFVPFGDINAFRTAVKTGKYRAFFIESIQGEGGMHVAPEGYFKEVRSLCDQYNTYLVCDEIQCGCGRSGKFWAIEYENIIPDCITFAKGFSGTYIPFAGFIATKELFDAAYDEETFEFSAGTYQLNDLGCAAANSVIEYIFENNLMEAAKTKGEYLVKKMRDLQAKYPTIIKEVRGRGLMLGIEFFEVPAALQEVMGDCYGTVIASRMIDVEHVQTLQCTNDLNSLHILPPLIISMDELDLGLRGMENAIEFAAVMTEVVKRVPR